MVKNPGPLWREILLKDVYFLCTICMPSLINFPSPEQAILPNIKEQQKCCCWSFSLHLRREGGLSRLAVYIFWSICAVPVFTFSTATVGRKGWIWSKLCMAMTFANPAKSVLFIAPPSSANHSMNILSLWMQPLTAVPDVQLEIAMHRWEWLGVIFASVPLFCALLASSHLMLGSLQVYVHGTLLKMDSTDIVWCTRAAIPPIS